MLRKKVSVANYQIEKLYQSRCRYAYDYDGRKLIKDEVDTVVIMRATGLTKEEIEEIKKNMLTTK